MVKKCPKCHISCNFGNIWPTKPITVPTKWVKWLKASINLYCQKLCLILTFMKWKCSKSAQNVIFHAILANYGTIWPTQRPLTLPRKYFWGPIVSQKSPYFSTTRNLIHSYLFEVKMFKSAQNVIFHAILASFGTIWPTQRPLTLQRKCLR